MFSTGSTELDACTSCSGDDACDTTFTGLCANSGSSDFGNEAC